MMRECCGWHIHYGCMPCRKGKEPCLNCEHRKIITHGVLPYNFCKKLNVSFTKNGPDDFLNCTKLN